MVFGWTSTVRHNTLNGVLLALQKVAKVRLYKICRVMNPSHEHS